MKSIVRVINETIKSADAECRPCDRVNLDYDRHREYLEFMLAGPILIAGIGLHVV